MFDDLTSWLSGVAWPIVKKVLAALGLGTITYEGLSAFGSQVNSEVIAAFGQIGGLTLQIFNLGGISQALGIMLSAFAARLVIVALGKIGFVGFGG